MTSYQCITALAVAVLVVSAAIYWVMTRKREAFTDDVIVMITDFEYPGSRISTGNTKRIFVSARGRELPTGDLNLQHLNGDRKHYIAIGENYKLEFNNKKIAGKGITKFSELPKDFKDSKTFIVNWSLSEFNNNNRNALAKAYQRQNQNRKNNISALANKLKLLRR